MKKLLALVLALVMTLGLATVGTSAAYTDANDIDYTEAVDVMTAVGVFQGKGDAFAPKDGLNRAEAAKLIAYLMLGNKTAESMKGSGAKFADVPASHWASGYIEYLATAGVVSGVGGGNFDPNGKVTAVAFAKMLLVALGYDAEIEGFTGNSSWAINIQKLANDNDLYDLLDVASTAALTREQAAQMCLNDLKADMVEYESKGTTVSVGDAKVTTDAKKATEKVEKGSNNYNNAAVNSSDRNYRQLAEELYGNDLKLTGTSDDLGRPANKWTYKSKDVGTYAAKSDCIYTTTSKVKVNALYDVVGKDAYENMVDGTDRLELFINGQSSATVINNGATEAARQTAVRKYFYKDSSADADNVGNGTLFEIYQTENYDGNNNDKYTVIAANTYLYQATADYSKTSESVKVAKVTDDGSAVPYTGMPTEIKQEDFAVSDIVKDDYLLVTYSQSAKAFQTVAKAEVVQGKITSYVSADSLTIDGTKHSYSATIGTNSTHGKGVEFDVGSEAKVVLDANGNIIFVDDADVSSTYVYIKNSGANTLNTKVEATAYFTDGTTKNITVKKASFYNGHNDTLIGAGQAMTVGSTSVASIGETQTIGTLREGILANQWYTYTVDSNGEYTLKAVGTNNVASGTGSYKNTDNFQAVIPLIEGTLNQVTNVLDKENVAFMYNGATNGATTKATTGNKATDETKIIVLDNDDDVTLYTGAASAPGITFTSDGASHTHLRGNGGNVVGVISYVYDADGYTKYAFVDLKDVAKMNVDDSTESKDYAFVLRPRTDKNYVTTSDYYYEYDLYRNGAVEKVVKVDEDAVSSLVRGTLVNKVKTNSKGYITGASAITSASGSGNDYIVVPSVDNTTGTRKITVSGNTITLNNTAYVLNTNEIVLVYDQKVENKGNVASLLDDANSNYEVNVVNGSTLDSNLKNYTYEYNFAAVLSDSSTNKIDQLYIRIYNAKEAGVVATPVVATGNAPATTLSGNDITIPVIVDATNAMTINGSVASDAAARSQVNAILAANGYTTTSTTFTSGPFGYVAATNAATSQGTVTAKNASGVDTIFDVYLARYYTIKINDTITDYWLHGTAATYENPTTRAALTSASGKGTSFIYRDSAPTAWTRANYYTAADTRLATGNTSIEYKTGYVQVTGAVPAFAAVGVKYTNTTALNTDAHYFVSDSDGAAIGVYDTDASGYLTIPAAKVGEKNLTLTQVYMMTVDGTVFYAASGKNLGAVGSSTNMILKADGSYITSADYSAGGKLYPLTQSSDAYAKVVGTATKFVVDNGANTTATYDSNGAALDEDVVITTGFYKVKVNVVVGDGTNGAAAPASDTVAVSTLSITTTGDNVKDDDEIYLQLSDSVNLTAAIAITGTLTNDLAYVVPTDDGAKAVANTEIGSLASGGSGTKMANLSYTLEAANPATGITDEDVDIVFVITDAT